MAKSIEDYYAGHGEAPGVWAGAGACKLGLSGQVAEGDLAPLLAGCQPEGVPLVSGKAAAKGMFAEGDNQARDAVRDAHDSAVA